MTASAYKRERVLAWFVDRERRGAAHNPGERVIAKEFDLSIDDASALIDQLQRDGAIKIYGGIVEVLDAEAKTPTPPEPDRERPSMPTIRSTPGRMVPAKPKVAAPKKQAPALPAPVAGIAARKSPAAAAKPVRVADGPSKRAASPPPRTPLDPLPQGEIERACAAKPIIPAEVVALAVREGRAVADLVAELLAAGLSVRQRSAGATS